MGAKTVIFGTGLFFAVLVCLGASAAPVTVRVNDGKLVRHAFDTKLTGWAVGEKECGYSEEHENVLRPVINLLQTKAFGYQFMRIPAGYPCVDGSDVSCGNSATKMTEAIRESGLLPQGWRVLRANSMDVTNLENGTAHTVYVLEAPDGESAYLMDSYFYDAEIMKMSRYTEEGPNGPEVCYRPAEANHLFATKGYVQLFGNSRNTWKAVADDVNFYFDPYLYDKSGTLKKAGAHAGIEFRLSQDPNDITGPSGAGPRRYVGPDTRLGYTVRFENVETADIAAAEVRVECFLDPMVVDPATVRLGEILIGEKRTALSGDAQDAGLDIDLRPALNIIARARVWVDYERAAVCWTFLALDPDTMDVPEDYAAGLLPPNQIPPEGQGAVSFSVLPRPDLETDREISTRASIRFDVNEPIDTPVWTNTIDREAPHSTVAALPAETTQTGFQVAWSGSDAHAGLAACTLHVSTDGGPFVPLTDGAEQAVLDFRGAAGHSYGFYSIAEDAAGNEQAAPAGAQAVVRVVGQAVEGEQEGEPQVEGESEGEPEGEGGAEDEGGCRGCKKSGKPPENQKGDQTTLAFVGLTLMLFSFPAGSRRK